jgi:hypothetical protein
MIRKIFVLLFFIGLSQILNAQSFKIIPLGVLGGSIFLKQVPLMF